MLEALKTLKDKGLAAGLRAWLSERYQAYGSVRSVAVDSTARRISFVLELHGESEPVELVLTHYEVVRDEGRTAVRLGRIECSRAWLAAVLNDLADDQLEDRSYPVEHRTMAELVRTLL